MAEIDLTFINLCNGQEVSEVKVSNPRATEAKVKDKKLIAPQFTKGAEELYENLGKKTTPEERAALLGGMETDDLFDELRRRFENLNVIIEGITSIVLCQKPVNVSPERIESLRADFQQAESIREQFKEFANL